MEAFRDMGYLPEALVNYLALLGWSHPEGKELLTLEELISSFSLDRLSPNPAIFDPQKLKWMNGYYLRNMPIEKLAELAKPFFEKAGIKIIDEEYFKKVLEITKERVEVLSEFPEESRFFFEDPAPVEIPEEMKEVFSQLKEELQNVRWTMEEITPVFKKVLKQHGVKPKEFYMTLRRVLTGREEGPELVNIIPLLGKEIFLRRIERSLGG